MSIDFNKFVKTKNNFYLAYFGPCHEYVEQLLFIKPFIEQQYNVNIHIVCRDELQSIYKNIITQSNFDNNLIIKNRNYKEIKSNLREHPIELLINENNVIIPDVIDNKNSNSNICIIYPNGIIPTKKLNDLEIELLINFCSMQGYTVEINKDSREAGWVVGVENLSLFQAAFSGIKTTLIDVGIGTNLFNILTNNKNKILKLEDLYKLKD